MKNSKGTAGGGVLLEGAELSQITAEQGGKAKRGRPFQPGVSGNPAGRPRGSKNRVKELCAELLQDESEAIVRTVIGLAKQGKPFALRLCVERLFPVQASRDRSVVIELPPLEKASDLVAGAAAVIQAAASGEISLSEANDVMKLLDTERKAIETQDISVRLEAIEARQRLEGPEAAPSLGQRVRRILVREDDGL